MIDCVTATALSSGVTCSVEPAGWFASAGDSITSDRTPTSSVVIVAPATQRRVRAWFMDPTVLSA